MFEARNVASTWLGVWSFVFRLLWFLELVARTREDHHGVHDRAQLDAELPIAFFGFDVGVEIGQLVFVAVSLALRPAWRRLRPSLSARFAIAGYYAVGTLVTYWLFARIALFLPRV